ncbi:glycosyltransferase family 2 protein [Radiobacillus sp. PE A8.2]|uniref:glycosyltransferase family 2 protein n=1 Tax=Radiobacillus sp. PE A8.2 TaxID=3380349 RepID=UPI00388F0405
MSIQREAGLVSIVVTSFNREQYLDECLDSLIAQTYQNVEIILIDDASSDNTMKVFEAFRSKVIKENDGMKDRITGIALPWNIGHEGATTFGMFLSRGEFIALQDSDDLSHSKRIEREISFLKENPNVDMVGAQYAEFIDVKDGVLQGLSDASNWMQYGDAILEVYKKGWHCMAHGTLLFRAHAFDRLGGYTRNYGKAADYEFIRKFIMNGVKADNIPEVLYYYRRHHLQMSQQ